MRVLVVVSLLVVALVLMLVRCSTSDPALVTSGQPQPVGAVAPAQAGTRPSTLPPGTVATHTQVERAPAAGLADSPTACLEVVDHTAQSPVAGAAVRRVHDGSEIAFTDDRGRASVPLREPEQLAVVRDGYLLRLVPARVGTTEAEPQQVRLVRDQWSPRVRFDFRAPDGSVVTDALVRFRSNAPMGKGSAPTVAVPPGDVMVQRAWTEHAMLAGRPVCADVAVELGAYAAGRVHRLASRQEVRFVVPGDYEMETATLGGWVARTSVRVATTAGVDAMLVRIDLVSGTFVGGTVTSGEPPAPLAGAIVSVEGGDPLGLLATTAADGTFRLEPLLPGTVTLYVHDGACEPQAKGPLQPPIADVRVHLQPLPKSTLRGRVRVRPGLEPLAGAKILWTPAGGTAITATSAADGTFVLRATGTTPSRLAVHSPRHLVYAELVEPGARFADYDVLPATTDVRLEKKLTALLEGIVVDASGMPLPNVPVRWTPVRPSALPGSPGRRVLEGGTVDLPLVAATGVDGAFRLETNHFGPGRLALATSDPAGGGGIEVDVVPGTTKNGLRLQR